MELIGENRQLRKQFQIDVGFDPTTVSYHAHVYSLQDKKVHVAVNSRLPVLMKEVSKALRKKELVNRNFPVIEQPVIVMPQVPKIIVPAGNGH